MPLTKETKPNHLSLSLSVSLSLSLYIYIYIYARGVMGNVISKGDGDRVQILEETLCIFI